MRIECQFCHGKKRAEMVTSDAEMIIRKLSQLHIRTCEPVKDPLISGLRNIHTPVSFMCGCCPESDNRLRRAEHKLSEELMIFGHGIKNGQVSPEEFHSIYNLLRGRYPNACRIMERLYKETDEKK